MRLLCFPPRYLLSVSDTLLKDIDRANEYVDVVKLGLGPPTSAEDVSWAKAGLRIGHVIPKEYSMLDCHWPQSCVGQVVPVDEAVHKHCSTNRHDGLNCLLGSSIVVMSSNAGETLHLLKI